MKLTTYGEYISNPFSDSVPLLIFSFVGVATSLKKKENITSLSFLVAPYMYVLALLITSLVRGVLFSDYWYYKTYYTLVYPMAIFTAVGFDTFLRFMQRETDKLRELKGKIPLVTLILIILILGAQFFHVETKNRFILSGENVLGGEGSLPIPPSLTSSEVAALRWIRYNLQDGNVTFDLLLLDTGKEMIFYPPRQVWFYAISHHPPGDHYLGVQLAPVVFPGEITLISNVSRISEVMVADKDDIIEVERKPYSEPLNNWVIVKPKNLKKASLKDFEILFRDGNAAVLKVKNT